MAFKMKGFSPFDKKDFSRGKLVEEMSKALEKMSNAEDCLLTLEENFGGVE